MVAEVLQPQQEKRNRQLHTSYIASVRMLSSKDLKPLAPVFLAIAFLAISLRAFSVKCSFTCNWEKVHVINIKRPYSNSVKHA